MQYNEDPSRKPWISSFMGPRKTQGKRNKCVEESTERPNGRVYQEVSSIEHATSSGNYSTPGFPMAPTVLYLCCVSVT